jgi:hypothetical protein
MSFSSNIFTSLPSVHTQNPDFLGRQLWLCFFADSWIPPRMTSELDPWQIPESAVPRSSCLFQFEVPSFRVFMTLGLHRFQIPEIRTFANPKLRRFQIPENREFPAPEKHISRTSLNSTFRGWRVFLNSPRLTLATIFGSRSILLHKNCSPHALQKIYRISKGEGPVVDGLYNRGLLSPFRKIGSQHIARPTKAHLPSSSTSRSADTFFFLQPPPPPPPPTTSQAGG